MFKMLGKFQMLQLFQMFPNSLIVSSFLNAPIIPNSTALCFLNFSNALNVSNVSNVSNGTIVFKCWKAYKLL